MCDLRELDKYRFTEGERRISGGVGNDDPARQGGAMREVHELAAPRYTLRYIAETGYVLGLQTIGETALHMELHLYAYFVVERFAEEMQVFRATVAGHEKESIMDHLTMAECAEIDAAMDEFFEGAAESDAQEAVGEEFVLLVPDPPHPRHDPWWRRLWPW